ncbi:MAG: hypothetical protein L7U72_08095, partial [Rubripirellula sp.]|nr:hypothetical protein [Rubripirellula sp.]
MISDLRECRAVARKKICNNFEGFSAASETPPLEPSLYVSEESICPAFMLDLREKSLIESLFGFSINETQSIDDRPICFGLGCITCVRSAGTG